MEIPLKAMILPQIDGLLFFIILNPSGNLRGGIRLPGLDGRMLIVLSEIPELALTVIFVSIFLIDLLFLRSLNVMY